MRAAVAILAMICACGGREIPDGTTTPRQDAGVSETDAAAGPDAEAMDTDESAPDAESMMMRVCTTMCGADALRPEPKSPCVLFPVPCQTQPIDAPSRCEDIATTREVPIDTPACDF